jgi:hypothetical protein
MATGTGTMKVTELSIWEQLGSIQQGWSELAANTDASPFTWPNFCLPWWYELGWGRLVSIAVEESGILVGLALLHDRVGDIGRHMIRFVGDEPGTFHQMLVADGRPDVTAVLWEQLLSKGRAFEFSAVPTEIAKASEAATSCPLDLTEHARFGMVNVLVDSADFASNAEIGAVRTVTEPTECLKLISGSSQALRWGSGEPGSKMAAFFASAADASMRVGRLTLHIEDNQSAAARGVLVLHGSGTSVVWRHVGRFDSDANPALVRAATTAAAENGSRRLLWPDNAGVPGQPFSLTDIIPVQERAGGRIREFSVLARSAVRGVRDYLTP